jgi:hypothetical protein
LHAPKNGSPNKRSAQLNVQSNNYEFANVNDPLGSNPHWVTHFLFTVSPKYCTVVFGQSFTQSARD